MNIEKTPLLIVEFKNSIQHHEIPKFRGAVVNMLSSNNILFHNHTEDGGLRYSYPLIQYKRIHGKAAIVCIKAGTESIGEFFSTVREPVVLGRQEIMLELDFIRADNILIQIWESSFTYSLRKWLPFNSVNYDKFQKLTGLKEQAEFMENILVGNILSFAKGIGIRFEKELHCTVLDMETAGMMKYKGVSFMAFDVFFRTNVSLPNYTGLGKGVSHGFGTVVKMNNNNEVTI
ncbi:MAG: hypothetical protein LBK97_06875 [Prevotellaceae bacterium]|jgi:hypothetical protein|nr:hypothetical protein [Prevotellaceae bacterium]